MAGYLEGKVAVVTGAGRGIGRGIALLMAREGASVVVNDPGVELDGSGGSTQVADEVVAAIRREGGRAVASYDSVVTMDGGRGIVQGAVDAFGRLDVVCTVAGVLRDRMVFNMGEEEWDVVVGVHLKGTFTVVKHAALLFRQQRSGRIITFTSTSGLYGNSGQANYGAAKDGVAGFTRVVARDLGRYGVTVNSISPGAVTRMTASVPDTARQAREQRGLVRVGPGITGDPDDVAPFVVWLASDRAAHVNGHIFGVRDGVVSLIGHPEPVRHIYKPGRWTVQEIARIFPSTLGMDLVNPAPPVPPPAVS